VKKTAIEDLRKFAAEHEIEFDDNAVAATLLPSDSVSLLAVAWMARYFTLMGDVVPNKAGELHLEPITKQVRY
jgi:hypothetical protein